MSSDKVLVPYEHRAAVGGKVRKVLHLYRIKRQKDILVVEDQTTHTPKMVRSPTQNKYVFTDEGATFVLDASTYIVKMVSKEQVKSPRINSQNQAVEENVAINMDEQPAWSRQGDKISYLVKRFKYGEIWVHDLLSSNNVKVYQSSQPVGLYGWTFEGQLIIWEGHPSHLKFINMSGEHISSIQLNDMYQLFHSPDGERLIYTVEQRPTSIYMYCFKERKAKLILNVAEGGAFLPQINFSTDGKRIVTLERQGEFARYIKTYDFEKKVSRVINAPIHKSIEQVPIWFNKHSFILSFRRDEDVRHYI